MLSRALQILGTKLTFRLGEDWWFWPFLIVRRKKKKRNHWFDRSVCHFNLRKTTLWGGGGKVWKKRVLKLCMFVKEEGEKIYIT